jgi:two-component system chemotaxis response regulator CheY
VKVLVADDDAGARLVAQASVERLGHECLLASDGDAAWELFGAHRPDVLVTDWMMPGLNGPQLCRAIRDAERDRYTYIVLLTSLAAQDEILAGMEAGADDYVVKPLDPFALQARLLVAKRVTSLHLELADYREKLSEKAQTDPLTKLLNRLKLTEDLEELHDRSERYERPYSLGLCDIDFFKGYNDTYGHQAGDRALQQVAAALASVGRRSDGLYRYGGEEFLWVLPETGATEAAMAVDRFCTAVTDLEIVHCGSGGGVLTVSAGISTFLPGSGISTEVLLRQADLALYGAKAAGRNRVVAALR